MRYSILALLVFTVLQVSSQELVLSGGINSTTYDYRDAQGRTNTNIESGSGSFYEIAYAAPMFGKRSLGYELGLVLDQYNAGGGTLSSVYSWRTRYMGVKAGLSYDIVNSGSGFKTALALGLRASSIFSGEQGINGATFDLTQQEEFKGVFLQPMAGIEISCPVSDNLSIGLGYDYSKSSKLGNRTEEELNFVNHRVQVRLRIALKGKGEATVPVEPRGNRDTESLQEPEKQENSEKNR